ncbi:arsenical pump-driving ATPase [Acetobacterium wieringae]|uniref:Arsenical pump-driving ATPase n=1 Tax=Acetobacterium wieringae TaxID=52694 RepID=A0A1F2PG58_9FIRM|nr:arsenical pump-driving ATPase [Acetobacterium wieringae]MEA4804898.1 arsenical pump-driving ATPase [Acetobacterium wieringae]OFV70337.1 arsenical pump-driving ATPase [Acetobacterium wieringae]TYC87079.1 arsenical pump-driving ATPase [Acetobacterium wieringae]URN86010.1 arsenical pump-driving ATPase [Acetobacterium wieringae]
MYKNFSPDQVSLTKYLFYTGKGGVGKTSTACATAVSLADQGKRVFLVSTDPASNLQDVFETALTGQGVPIKNVPNLVVANLDPIQAAEEYKESVVGPYRGKLPDVAIASMEEQLAGSCTVEIAAFNEFSRFITDEKMSQDYDYIIFDTAPTGHTLRMLQLPSAWDSFIDESTHGASCLGQLSGLTEQKKMYEKAVRTLSDGDKTTLILVSRPEPSPLAEAARASKELKEIGVDNQILIINGALENFDRSDDIATAFYGKQKDAVKNIPNSLKTLDIYTLPLRAYNVAGVDNIRRLFTEDDAIEAEQVQKISGLPGLENLVKDLADSNKKVIFTMGKGGVGKTTIAAAIALGLSKMGKKVYLTTTDPAGHLSAATMGGENITVSNIDEAEELNKYRDEVIGKAKAANMSQDDIDYIIEDLESPCTQEIAVFRAFAEQVEKAEDGVVVIDTAPTGHTLLLLNSTESYHKEMQRSNADIPDSVVNLLPRLQNQAETEVVIVALPEATPVFEALRLEADLKRAGILSKWWVMNASLLATDTKDPFLRARANNEQKWIKRIAEDTNGNYVVIPWKK